MKNNNFTSINLDKNDFVFDLNSAFEFSEHYVLPLLSTGSLKSSSPVPSDLQPLEQSDTPAINRVRRSHFNRFMSGFYHVTRSLNLRRFHYNHNNHSEIDIVRAVSSVDEASTVPILSQSSVYPTLTTRFITNWSPVRIRSDDIIDGDLQRFPSRLFRTTHNSRTDELRRSIQLSEDSGSDLLTFNDISANNTFNYNAFGDTHSLRSFPSAINGIQGLELGESEEEEPAVSPFHNQSRVNRVSTFSRILRFSFHRTRRSVRSVSKPHPTPICSPQENYIDEAEEFNESTSTGSTSKDPIRYRRKTFRDSIGRNRELYKMLGRFDDFYGDPATGEITNEEDISVF